MNAGAKISACGRYRYRLWRIWDEAKYCLPFCMLNPSTADASADDPTIRRCVGFAKREGYGGIHVVNLYALRATKPSDLWSVADPLGHGNMNAICDTINAAQRFGVPIVCAWGGFRHPAGRGSAIRSMLAASFADRVCLGKTAAGDPRHPLYVRADYPLEPFR